MSGASARRPAKSRSPRPAGEQSPLIAGATLQARRQRPHRPKRPRAADARRGDHPGLAEFQCRRSRARRRKRDCTTTIIQQSGSILLEVEKKNVQHFQVETPYLAAVVKGTQFRVTVGNSESRVDVLRGQVEVADFKSGQFAMVAPGQAAQVSSARYRGSGAERHRHLRPDPAGHPARLHGHGAAGRAGGRHGQARPGEPRGIGARRHPVDARDHAGWRAAGDELDVGVHARQGVRRLATAAAPPPRTSRCRSPCRILIGAGVAIAVGRPAPPQGQEDDSKLMRQR